MKYWWKELETFEDHQSFASGEDFFNLENWLHKIEICGYNNRRAEASGETAEETQQEIQAEHLRDLITDMFVTQYLKHITTKNDALLHMKDKSELIREHCKKILKKKSP